MSIEPTPQNCKILLVEDEAIPAMMIELGLTSFGYEMCPTVASGEEAVRVAGQERPDLILMDINLTGKMDGIQAAEQIKALYNIPIVFLTGYTDLKTAERANQLSPLAYRIKPVSLYEIHKIIQDWQRTGRSSADVL